MVGTAKVEDGHIGRIDMGVSFHDAPLEVKFSDEGDVYFVFPIDPQEGVEGAYLRLLKLLGVLQ
ncbi:hypothetical protein E3E25_04785 [Thermococcus sp. MAR1]|nr:hypothetical protein [Thermococcus sp. MAR1]